MSDAEPTAVLRHHGHACFSLALADGRSVVIDPYASGALGGAVALAPLADRFTWAIATHRHADHDAFHAVPAATPLTAPWATVGLVIERIPAAHDEFGGRLRGGGSDVLVLRTGAGCVVHCGDLGERPAGALLESLRGVRPDVLIVPVGGYYTLGADGAAELVSRLAPRVAIPCHSADDGVRLPALAPRALFTDRFDTVEHRECLALPVGDEVAPIVVLARV